MANDTIVQYVLKVDAKGAQQGLDRTAKEADQAAKSLDKLGDESKGANRDLKNTEKQSKTASKSLAGLKVAGAAAAGAIAGIATVGAAAIGTIASLGNAYIDAQKAAFDFSREVVDNVNQLNDLSAQSGLTADLFRQLLQRLKDRGKVHKQRRRSLEDSPVYLLILLRAQVDRVKQRQDWASALQMQRAISKVPIQY